ncbi:MAG: phosphoenolpyruvate--protein phosphotransferase [Eubacteriales bacterium]
MKEFKGFGVYGAIAIGRVAVLTEETEGRSEGDASGAPHSPESEEKRLGKALELAKNHLDGLYRKTLSQVGEEEAEIFSIHRMMLEDPDFVDGVRKKIKDGSSAESAVRGTARELADLLLATEDDYLQERSVDVRDASETLIAVLTGRNRSLSRLPEGIPDPILCADDLTPSQTAELDKDRIRAFVTAGGSSNSHTAILARSRGIPAVVALGKNFLSDIQPGQIIAVNGYTGQVFLDPDRSILAELSEKMEQDRQKKEELRSLIGLESRTKSGKTVDLYANIGGVNDLSAAQNSSAEGIGLMRSEFLYLGRRDYPTEEEQFSAYRQVLEGMAGRRVVIRTLDIGADKQADYFGLPHEDNPALGYRAIRICLDRVDLFKTQLRALYRASVFGRLAILFPMIASVWEVEAVRKVCNQVQSELEAEGIEYSRSVELGIMIETPSSAILSDRLAGMVDFFSIGTNDLTQYTLACDRQNSRLARFCDPHHEAIFRLIETVVQNAHRQGKWVGICGELAADTKITRRLIGMGIDELSVSPAAVLNVRKAIRECQ